MIADALLGWLFDGAIATSAAMLLVLALRHPLRRAFGARIAYRVWVLVPLALVAVSLPAPRSTTALLQALPALRPAVIVGAAMPLQATGAAAAMPAIDWMLLLATAWCIGAVLLALRFRRQQRQFIAGLGQLQPGGGGTYIAAAGHCPVVIGAWRPRIVLPADFATRYPGAQGSLVVAHERAHVLRGDVRANLFAAVLRCLHWFNPLLHAAAARFRLDQELACDAAVLACNPHARRAYADAMLNTQLAVPGLPVGCHWQSSQSLKERILMLKQPQPGAWRRRVGGMALCLVLAGSSYAAWALRPASDMSPAYRGYVEDKAIAIATVQVPDGIGLEVSGGSMSTLRGGHGTSVMLDPGVDLRMQSKDASDPWLLRARAVGTIANPVVEWSLERNGRVERETTLPVTAGAPTAIDLSMLADAQGRAPALAFLRLPADRVIENGVYGGTDGSALVRDPDGAYRQGDPIHSFSSDYKTDGNAVLLVGVGADGRVQTIDIESITPAGAITGAQADQLVGRYVYKPQLVDGKPVPTRIRVPVEFARAVPPVLPLPAASPSTGTMTRAAERTPPPRYPEDAAANKVGGKVVLILDVAADGSVSHVSVEKSEPAGVFDAAAIEAAGKWTLKPTLKDGKPVAGRVRVPITFSPDGKGESPTGVSDNARPGLAG